MEDKEKERIFKSQENEKARQFKLNEEFKHEKEMAEIKNQNALQIEKVKTERKEKTVSHINNIHIENKIQNEIQNNIILE
ncbi:MAG: hypothetical protein ACRCZI_12070, partial [Cetobacterium sp.]